MNETRVFADGYRGVFQKQEDFLECLKSIGRNSFWERRNSKNLRLVAITSGSKVEEELKEIDPSIVIEWFLHLGNQHGAYSLFLEQVHYAVPVFFRPFPLDISRLFCSASIRSITLPGSLVSAVTISCP